MSDCDAPAITHVYLADIQPRPRALDLWERKRNGQIYWLVECIAEATGTFFFTYCGVGSTASYVVGNILGIAGLSSTFQIGVAYGLGVIMAFTVCVTTSWGHFSPSFTICAVIFGKTTPLKGLRLIISQILGSYIACLLVYVQYRDLILSAVEALQSKGVYDQIMFTPSGPAGIFALYTNPGMHLGFVFVNEFVCDFVLALVVFAAIEPSNQFSPPFAMPWIIALAYAVMIWGFAPAGLAANAARDVGGRLAALTLWGKPASGGNYAAIAALVNIPATICAAVFYQLIFNDSARTVTRAHLEFEDALKAERDRKNGVTPASTNEPSFSDEKIGGKV